MGNYHLSDIIDNWLQYVQIYYLIIIRYEAEAMEHHLLASTKTLSGIELIRKSNPRSSTKIEGVLLKMVGKALRLTPIATKP